MSGFRWASASASETGHVRERNEDACLDEPALGLWAVADGMGGHDAGDVASRAVVDALRKVRSADDIADVVHDVEQRMSDANDALQAIAAAQAGSTIGSTVAVLAVSRDEAACAWAGDSRVYRYRRPHLEQLSRDHSEVEMLVADGRLGAEDAQTHPNANVLTRAVGANAYLELETAFFSLRDDDRYLLCTDGLYRELSAAQLCNCMVLGNAAQVCGALMETALQGPCDDNVSAVIVEFEQVK